MPKIRIVKQIKSKIISNKLLTKSYWRCVMCAPDITRSAKPGQFINIKTTSGLVPLLRRPFSIHNIDGEALEIIYDIVGEGTKALSQKRSGEYLDVIGPLGNGFSLPGSSKHSLIFVGGGVGIAPLFLLARKATTKNKIVLIGSKNKESLLCKKEFKDLGCEVKISTDDGSCGLKGKITALLRETLDIKIREKERIFIYACGPKPMLKEVFKIVTMNALPAQFSLEEHMGCGIGACLGCVVKTKKGLERVCKEGPVFDASDLAW